MSRVQRVMAVVDASFVARQNIEKALREIDRRALNAMILVKKHGNALAGYGVVAQAFRERAAHLRESASHLQENMAPLIHAQTRMLQLDRYLSPFRALAAGHTAQACPTLSANLEEWDNALKVEQQRTHRILARLLDNVRDLQAGVEEQEYVVTSGRIEAALAENSGAPLMRVSRDMGEAVAVVAAAVRQYRQQLEQLYNESDQGL